MKERVPITVSLYGFAKEQEPIMRSAFAHADQWDTPWTIISSLETARVVFINLASEADYKEIEKLQRDFPKAEIVAFSSKKPPQARWHLVRQPNGKASIVAFSQLVLKIAHSLKKNLAEISEPELEKIAPIGEPNAITETVLASVPEADDLDQESSDFLPFFNTLDSLLDSKPNQKRKRFNES
jgi:hypothetical protein